MKHLVAIAALVFAPAATTTANEISMLWGDSIDSSHSFHVLHKDNEAAQSDETTEGSQTWVTLLCQFADIPEQPHDLAYFHEMIHRPEGGLDHYWQEASYGAINLQGSFVVDWLPLPGDHLDYVSDPNAGCSGGSTADLSQLFEDCTAAADGLVDYSEITGIQIMLNDEIGGCAWAGKRVATLDGVTTAWPVTWIAPSGYTHEGVVAHEMGHSYGLPHSNNSDLDTNTYDSPWDVMSSSTGGGIFAPPYGRLPVHTIGHHKDMLGWLPPERVVELEDDGRYSLTLEHLAQAEGNALVRIPLDPGGRTLTAEVRGGPASYFEQGLPSGDPVVLLYEVDLDRLQPAWLIDADDPPATWSGNEGVMWRPGETFETPDHPTNHTISISIDAVIGDGLALTIDLTKDVCPGFDDSQDQDLDGVPDGCDTCPGAAVDICGICGGDGSSCAEIFTDGFESGTLERWLLL